MKNKIAILSAGGPAPGINGVISSITIEAIREGWEVYGILEGFKRLFQGEKNFFKRLSIEDVSRIHWRGGSILRTSRVYPKDFSQALKNLEDLLLSQGISSLITIGGDGTSYVAYHIHKRGKISVIHVPKSIDNDLPLPSGVPTFGFESARDLGTKLVKNLMQDSYTLGRWYLVTTMGRYTGHLALGIGLSAGATLTLIPEEWEGKNLSLSLLIKVIEGSILKRLLQGKNYGVILLAEGLLPLLKIEEKRLSQVFLGEILRKPLERRLTKYGFSLTLVAKNLGYELRSSDPIAFDIAYTRSLGFSSFQMIKKGLSGYVVYIQEGRSKKIPLEKLIDPKAQKIKIRKVDIQGEIYQVARSYMIRLEKEDFLSPNIEKFSSFLSLSPLDFKKRYQECI